MGLGLRTPSRVIRIRTQVKEMELVDGTMASLFLAPILNNGDIGKTILHLQALIRSSTLFLGFLCDDFCCSWSAAKQ